jgi:hypothetical protein
MSRGVRCASAVNAKAGLLTARREASLAKYYVMIATSIGFGRKPGRHIMRTILQGF